MASDRNLTNEVRPEENKATRIGRYLRGIV